MEHVLLVPGSPFVLAELYAMKLDGILSPIVGVAFRPCGVAETPGLRAAALQHQIPAALAQRAALSQLSAAWVYGCAPVPGVIALMHSHHGKSAALPPFSGCTLRQVYFADADVQRLDGVLLTSPLRTALDVARTAPRALAWEVLFKMSSVASLQCPLGRVRQALQSAAHVPGKVRGQELVEDMIRNAET
jgi:hypothetical protein